MMGWTEAKTRNLLYRGLADLRTRLSEMGIGWQQAEESIVNDERLRAAYGTALRSGVAGGNTHASPEAIAALVRREGPESERLATLDHVMSCLDCRRDFDLLRAVEQAGRQVGAARTSARPTWLMPAALAASLLVAIGLGQWS